MYRRWKAWAAAICLLLAGLTGSGLTQAQVELSKVTIAVGGKPQFSYLPLTVADQLGYFKDEGLDVKITDFAGGTKALQAVIGGSADVVSGAFDHIITLQAKGLRYTGFVLQGRTPQMVVGVASAKAGTYRSPRDLKGMKIGVTAPGAGTHMLVAHMLAQDGLKSSDVSIIGVGGGASAIAGLRAGNIDAISGADPMITLLQEKNEIKIIADTRTLKGSNDVFGGPMPSSALFASQAFIQKNPNTVQALTNAIVRALRWIQKATPAEVAKTVPPQYLLGDEALYMRAFTNSKEAMSPDGLFPMEGAQVSLRTLSAFYPEITSDKIKLEDTFTNQFVFKADNKYK